MELSKFLSDNLVYILIIVGGFITWKTGLVSSMVSNSKTVIELKEKELQSCERLKLDLENKLKDMDSKLKSSEEEGRKLFRDTIQKSQLEDQDRIKTYVHIRELEARIRELQDKK